MFECELQFCTNFIYSGEYVGMIHAHPCYELVYYVKGNGRVKVGEQIYDFKEKSYLVISPNVNHHEKGEFGVEVLYIGFVPINKNIQIKQGLYIDNDDEILSLMNMIYQEKEKNGDFYGEILNKLTEVTILKAIRQASGEIKSDLKDIEYITEYMRENCMKNISVKDIAKNLSYSYDYFRHKFVEIMGITAKEYLHKERFKYAINLLDSTNNAIKEVAIMSGYSSPSHFCKVFKDNTGMTINQYVSDKAKKFEDIIL